MSSEWDEIKEKCATSGAHDVDYYDFMVNKQGLKLRMETLIAAIHENHQ